MRPKAFFSAFVATAATLAAASAAVLDEDESIVIGGIASMLISRTPVPNQTSADSSILVPSCGSLEIEMNIEKRIAGRVLPDIIRTINPLSESCRSSVDLGLPLGQVIASVSIVSGSYTVNWYTYIYMDDDEQEVMIWSQDLDERYGDQLEKVLWCDPSDEPQAEEEPECFVVRLEEFAALFVN